MTARERAQRVTDLLAALEDHDAHPTWEHGRLRVYLTPAAEPPDELRHQLIGCHREITIVLIAEQLVADLYGQQVDR